MAVRAVGAAPARHGGEAQVELDDLQDDNGPVPGRGHGQQTQGGGHVGRGGGKDPHGMEVRTHRGSHQGDGGGAAVTEEGVRDQEDGGTNQEEEGGGVGTATTRTAKQGLETGTLNFADMEGCKFAETLGWKVADNIISRVEKLPTLFFSRGGYILKVVSMPCMPELKLQV